MHAGGGMQRTSSDPGRIRGSAASAGELASGLIARFESSNRESSSRRRRRIIGACRLTPSSPVHGGKELPKRAQAFGRHARQRQGAYQSIDASRGQIVTACRAGESGCPTRASHMTRTFAQTMERQAGHHT